MLTDKLAIYPAASERMGAGAQPTWPCGHSWLKVLLLPRQGWAQELWLSRWWLTMCGAHLAPGTADHPLTIRSCKGHQAEIQAGNFLWKDRAGRSLSPPGCKHRPPRALSPSQFVAVVSSASLEKSQP